MCHQVASCLTSLNHVSCFVHALQLFIVVSNHYVTLWFVFFAVFYFSCLVVSA